MGALSHFFRRLCNLTATLTAYVFEKYDIHNRVNALETTRSLLRRLILSHSTSLRGFAHGSQQTELKKTLGHAGKCTRFANACKNLRGSPSQKLGSYSSLFCDGSYFGKIIPDDEK